MQTIELTGEEFTKLPNYSCSVPTGVITGKRWKRAKKYDDQDMTRVDKWLIGEYQEDGSIVWYAIQLAITVQEAISRYIVQQLEGYPIRVTSAWQALRQGPPDEIELLLKPTNYRIIVKPDAVHIFQEEYVGPGLFGQQTTYVPLTKFPLDQVNLMEQIDEWLGRNLKNVEVSPQCE